MLLKNTLRGWNAVALMAAVLAAAAAPSAAVAKDRSEAFTAGIQITEWLQVPSEDPGCQPEGPNYGSAAQGFIDGSGLATVIGPFTLNSLDCVRSAYPSFYPPFTFSSTAFKLIDADGDEIVASYSGTAELLPIGLLTLKGSFKFTGGTGKYGKVKGSGTLLGLEDISTMPARGYVTLTGKISR